MNYQLTLNQKQLKQIEQALELYSRLAIGQFKEALRPSKIYDDFENNKILRNLAEIMEYTYDRMNQNRVIRRSHGDLSWEMYQTIRQQLSYDAIGKKIGDRDWSIMIGVCYDDPLKITNEPLVKIEKIDE